MERRRHAVRAVLRNRSRTPHQVTRGEGFEGDQARHLRVALGAVVELDRHLDDRAPRTRDAVSELDLERVAGGAARLGLHGAAAFGAVRAVAGGQVVDRHVEDEAGVPVAPARQRAGAGRSTRESPRRARTAIRSRGRRRRRGHRRVGGGHPGRARGRRPSRRARRSRARGRTRNPARYAAPSPSLPMRRSTAIRPSSVPTASAIDAVPSGLLSSTTRMSASGSAARDSPEDGADVAGLVVGGDHHEGGGRDLLFAARRGLRLRSLERRDGCRHCLAPWYGGDSEGRDGAVTHRP